MNRINTIAAAALALLGLAQGAQAHQIWIEQPAGQQTATLRFGEFGENLREASPGLLDKFGQPTAMLIAGPGERAGEVRKTADGFALPFGAARGDSIVAADERYPLYTWKKDGKETLNRYYPAARLITSFAAQAPKLALDLVPTGKAGEFRLYLLGQPKAGAKVELVTQSGWAKEAQTDAQGLVQFDMPWKGTYVAEVSVNDAAPGERAGAGGMEKFDAVSYVTSLTYVKPDGVEPIPALPAAAPNK
ncbi:MAG: cobalt ABC transporter substrate-binding protein [Comamonas sp.]